MDRTVETKRRSLAKGAAVLLAATALTGCGADRQQPEPGWPTVAEPTTKLTDVPVFQGGCDTMPSVFAQGVAEPWGAAERAEPFIAPDNKVGGFKVNEKIPVEGWYRSEVASYPGNPEPFEGRVWLKTTENTWVNTAGVRSKETRRGEPGNDVELPMECQIEKVWQTQEVLVTP